MKPCPTHPLSRRNFLRTAGGVAAGCALLSPGRLLAQEPLSRTPLFAKNPAEVTLVFCHIPSGTATWPTKIYDYDGRARVLADKLAQACPSVRFTVRTALSAADAQAIVSATPGTDGYLVYVIGIWSGAPNVFLHSGKPVVMVDDLFAGTGEVLILNGRARREKLPVLTVSSSDFADVAAAARLFAVIRAMKESTILDLVDYDIAESSQLIKELFGIRVERLGSSELADYYGRADEKEAGRWADVWLRRALRVVEPTRQDLVNSGKMYLALSRAAADRHADAVTMDCLGMFYTGRVSAYPCFSHFQMNNDGGTGVCEGDLNSTCSQLLLRYLTGRPGYVSDPVIDTARNEIIYAHCVATNRVFGPQGKANPYIIRSHAEDGKGASIQSLLPLGEPVTSMELDVRSRRLVVHGGRTTRNVNETKACRTKLAARTDARRILDNWDLGWHRVTVYGDWRRQILDLARLYWFETLEEDRAMA